jgi:hypothetical protein
MSGFRQTMRRQASYALTDLGCCEITLQTAVLMLHGGDAGGDHLEGRIEGIEIEIDPTRHQARDEPQFERHIGRPELYRGQPDMVVRVDKARQQYLPVGAEDRKLGMVGDQVGRGAALGDNAVAP